MDQPRCGSCGAALAPADALCAACGEAVPVESRVALLGARAEAQAEEGFYGQAARTAEILLALPQPPQRAKQWWRKRASWLRREGGPGSGQRLEEALRRCLELDDGDDLSHQLWMDHLRGQGRLDEARDEYKRRLESDPADAVAKRHLAALRLMEELKNAPVPKLDLPKPRDGMFSSALRPTPVKMAGAALGALSCLYILGTGWHAGAAPVALPAGEDSMASIVKLAEDPWINGLQLLAYALYLVWGWRTRRDA